MSITQQIAKHIKEVHFGGNWTWSNLKDNLADVTWQQALTKIDSFNNIATLTFHINYFVAVVNDVLEGKPLDAHDKFSFNHPPINCKEDWDQLCAKVFADGEKLVRLVEQLPDEKLDKIFFKEKYGNYYRNLHGLIEHTHYHLGQIAIIKKLVQKRSNP